MPGFLVHVNATVQCAHLGVAQPTAPVARVLVSCATAQWTRGATRVFALGQPVVLLDSQAMCTPTGTPLLILATQTRVTGI